MMRTVVKVVSAIDEKAWTLIEYTCDGEAKVAECDYKGRGLVVRRIRLVGHQATLWRQWRQSAFVRDIEGEAVDVETFRRAHATISSPQRRCRPRAPAFRLPVDGGSAYRVHVPPSVPVNNFWSVLVYDTQTRSIAATGPGVVVRDQPGPERRGE
jgi:hypothetical protein